MIDTLRDKIEGELEKLCREIPVDNDLKEAINYAVLSGGKRLRPILVLSSYELYSDNFEYIMPYALGIELIHNYSLVHDDLPAMDNDDYRRGKQTLHKKFNEATAILAGDAMLTYAFQIILEDIRATEDLRSIKNKINSLEVISKKIGLNGMILGQIIDIEDGMLSLNELLFMYKRKTSDLFNAALSVGAIIGGADIDEQKTIEDFGENLGLLFQIKDDIQDHERDMQIGKVTVATAKGLKESRILIEEYYEAAKKCLKKLEKVNNRNTSSLTKVLNLIKDN
ncbi:MAG: polyprenyl synthetase family protein [Tissierellia bacterium]|nr:polyprenyl synthetase family protein [Tissierellia bacterium]